MAIQMNIENPSSRKTNFLSNRSNLNPQENPRRKPSPASLVFLQKRKMCFDIDVEKYSLEDLRETLSRITSLLNKPTVVDRLPDQGFQLRQSQLKLQNEIRFREGLNLTHEKMQQLSLKCASEADLENAHVVRLCSLERKPGRERFKPNLAVRPLPSGRSESMKDLRSGVQLLDLATSLSLQRKQDERTKAEQLKAKQDRLIAALMCADDVTPLMTPEDSLSDLESLSDFDFEESDEELDMFNGVEDGEELVKVVKDYVFNGRDATKKIEEEDEDQPGPSGVQMVKIVMKAKPEAKESSEESDDVEPAFLQGVQMQNHYFRVKKYEPKQATNASAVPDTSVRKATKRKKSEEEESVSEGSTIEDA